MWLTLAALSLIPLYLIPVGFLPANSWTVCESEEGQAPGVTDKVGFCSDVGFSLQRSYYFGLVELPVYKAGINLDLLNKTFIPLSLLMTGFVWRQTIFKQVKGS